MTMKAWICRSYQDPFQLSIEEIARPTPGPGEILIETAATALSFSETLVLKGQYQLTPPLPYVPVSELSGIVRACGPGVARFRPGDAVAAFSFGLKGGGLAEFAVMPEAWVFAKPPDIDFAQAAAFPINYWTAFNALYRRAALRTGETLLVHGATGGIGFAAVQIGKAMGATVIAVGGDDDKLAVVKAHGADHLVNHRSGELRLAIKALTGGRGADVVFDPVGGDAFDQSMRAVAPGGRILVVGATSGRWAQPRTNILLVKMIAVIGVEARLALETTGDEGLADFHEMLRWIEAGRIVPFVGRSYPFAAAMEGFADLLARNHLGKSVVIVNPALAG